MGRTKRKAVHTPPTSPKKTHRKKNRKRVHPLNRVHPLKRHIDEGSNTRPDDDVRRNAVFAGTSYQTTANERRDFFTQHMGDNTGWTLDETLSDTWRAVWVNEDSKSVMTSFRGTKEFTDLPADVHLAMGMPEHSYRFRQTAMLYGDVLDKYDGYNQQLSGHSLGGALNKFVERLYQGRIDEVHNFNPGSGVGDVVKGIHSAITGTVNENVHDYFIHGDPLSVLGGLDSYSRNHYYGTAEGASNPHSLSNFYL